LRSRRHLRPKQDNNFVLDTSEGVQQFWAGISRILVMSCPAWSSCRWSSAAS